MTTGFVYAISNGRGAVKIGWSNDPVRRLSEINVSDADDVRLIGYALGTREHECEIQRLLRPHRLRGEWFREEGAVLSFLALLPKHMRLLREPKAGSLPRIPNCNSIAEIMASWGERPGTAARALALELGAEFQAVRMWAKRGRVPIEWVLPFVEAAQRKGLADVTVELVTALSAARAIPQPNEAA